MKNLLFFKYFQVFAFIMSAVTMISCGGGGGGDDAPPMISYTGPTTQATITEDNAAALTDLLLGRFRTVLAASAGMEGGADERSGTIYGDCDGTMDYNITPVIPVGDFTAAFSFKNFCDQGNTISGTVKLSGKYRSEDKNIQITINNMSTDGDMHGSDEAGDYIFHFRLSAVINKPKNQEIITADITDADMVFRDGDAPEETTYMYEDVDVSFTSNSEADPTYEEYNITTGRFYHSDYGYVEILTPVVFRTEGDDNHPVAGQLVVTGAGTDEFPGGNTKARLTILSPTSYKIEADTDGDGTYDYDSGEIFTE